MKHTDEWMLHVSCYMLCDRMLEHVLEKLFDSAAKVRLLKLFLRNEGEIFRIRDIVLRTQMPSSALRKPLEQLREIGFLRATMRKTISSAAKSKKQKGRIKRKKSHTRSDWEYVYTLNPSFAFYQEIRNLVLKSSPASKRWMTDRMKALGHIKVAVISGIFVRQERENMHTDLLVVADDVSPKRLENFVRTLEAEVGTRVNYTLLGSEEFGYRLKMFDRFVLDIMEGPHEKLINKVKI